MTKKIERIEICLGDKPKRTITDQCNLGQPVKTTRCDNENKHKIVTHTFGDKFLYIVKGEN
jgi:hypothetical protein